MKYAIISIIALATVFALSFLGAGLARRRLKKKPPMAVHILICIGTAFAVIAVIGLVFANINYKADEMAVEAFANSGGTEVREIDGGYMVDGSGDETALIFYPGAKVDRKAYLPLMERISEGGIDCFVLDPSFGMSIFSPNAADKIIENRNYDTFILSGHSMGGMTAAGYASSHKGVDGVALLAAYPAKDIPDATPLLSVYGTEDKVLDHNVYEDSKKYFPSDFTEVIIDGGNHAQFGNYGAQKGDGEAKITSDEQQKQTADAILKFADKIKN